MAAKKFMYSVSVNPEHKSKEVRFYSRPSDEVRTYLKKRRFRWNKVDGLWYGFYPMADLTEDINNLGYELVDVLPEKKRRAPSAKKLMREETARREKEELDKEEKEYKIEMGLLPKEEKEVIPADATTEDLFGFDFDAFGDFEPEAPEAPETPETKTNAPVPVKAEVIKGVVWVTYDNGMMECL